MCAIIGALGRVPSRETFIKARDTMTHRGPDDAGLYYAPKEGIALGHRRLSIIDLSHAGRQPFRSHDGRFSITFNGEIYNYREIRRELKGFYPFQTKTDTEVLLVAYMKWGTRCLGHLRGMFAFAVWDRERRMLFIARDRLGIKPLYYSEYKGNFYFASEIKGILELTGMPRKLNKQSMLDYFSYRYPLGDKTFFEKIASLLPGHYFVAQKNVPLKLHKYWELPVVTEKKDTGKEEVLETTEKLLEEAVKSHMISDAPIGAHLSGGLDSSLLAALMAQYSNKPIKTFSVGFKEKDFNEFSYARMVAERIKSEHQEYIVDKKKYFEELPKVILFKDAPLLTPNEVPLYLLTKKLQKSVKVVLSGGGADELFGGYGRIFRSGYDFERMNSLLASRCETERGSVLINNLTKKYGKNFPNTTVGHFLSQYPYSNITDIHFLLNKEIFDVTEENILNKKFFEENLLRVAALPVSEQYMHFFQREHLVGTLLHLDNVSMSASVEARVPYVDHALVEYVSALPLRYKLAWKSQRDEAKATLLNSNQISDLHDIPKYLIKEIGLKYLPGDIIRRKKIGFPVPIEMWLQDETDDSIKEILFSKKYLFNEKALRSLFSREKEGMSVSTARMLWALLNVGVWLEEYKIIL